MCAGPCSVESREQILESARAVKAAGAQLLRGGAYKPRTSPYAFQGLGEEGLRYLAEARDETGLGIVTEAIDVETFDLVEEYADCIQIGARNMQNFSLLRRAGRARKPILLKRGMSSTLEEFLMAAEYILSEGNYQVILCERGVRTFADHTRNTLDLSVVPAVQRLSHLPIIVDPSHGTGKRDKVHPMALAAVAAGASGLIVEVHPNPDRALSDGYQSLYPGSISGAGRRVPRHCRAFEKRSRRAPAVASTPDWKQHGIRIIRADDLDSNTPQTSGHDARRRHRSRPHWREQTVGRDRGRSSRMPKPARIIMAILRRCSTSSKAARDSAGANTWNSSMKLVRATSCLFRPTSAPGNQCGPEQPGGSGGGAQRAGSDRRQPGYRKPGAAVRIALDRSGSPRLKRGLIVFGAVAAWCGLRFALGLGLRCRIARRFGRRLQTCRARTFRPWIRTSRIRRAPGCSRCPWRSPSRTSPCL